METKVYKGYLRLEDPCNEDEEILVLGDLDCPIAEIFEDDFVGKQVSIRYWISDREISKKELQQEFINQVFGQVSAEYRVVYSDITGYLYTTEDLVIGGHDLLEELRTFVGNYLYLEVDVH